MKKFNLREQLLIVGALKSARNRMLEQIDSIEKAGKVPLFTKGYIQEEYDSLIDKVKTHSKKINKRDQEQFKHLL